MSLIERVQTVRQSVAEDDRPTADSFGDRGVLTLGVAGNVHPAAEGNRPSVEALTSEDLPEPTIPASTTFGAVIIPR